MELYLVQHGEAMWESEHPERPLTARGREEVGRVAAVASRMRLRPSEIRHSGKRRAAETAAIVAEALGLRHHVTAVSGLSPNDDVRPVAAELQDTSRSLMLVGHLPFMSRLASLLLTADPDRTVIRFRNGGIVCLVSDEPAGGPRTWSVTWVLTPELAAAQSL